MKHKVSKILLFGTVLIFIVPIIFTQITNMLDSGRNFEWVSLNQTNYQNITFYNADKDLDFAGMLFVPEGQGPFPAVVIIHGSGPSIRDNGWYRTLTKYLQDNGIVVVLPDKRGSELSEVS